MPTLVWLESFEHQVAATQGYGTTALWDTINTAASCSFVTGRRTGSHALQIVQDGANSCRIGKQFTSLATRTLVVSFYFKVSAKPSVNSQLSTISVVGGAGGGVEIATSTGYLQSFATGSGGRQTNSVDYCDGNWHRVDLKFVSSGTTFTMDCQVDGNAFTQASTGGQTAADITDFRFGSNNTAHTLTAQYADAVVSATSGDYPIGAHFCTFLIVNADGTHNWSSTNMGDSTGGRASSITDLNTMVDEFPPNTTDYIAYTNIVATSTEYAEVLLPDVGSGATIWAARAFAAIFSANTPVNAATTRIVDGANATVLDLYVGDQSDTALRYQAAILPGVDTPSEVNALKWRVGFPTDSNPAPRWSALMVDIALPGATGDGTATPSAVAGVGAVPAPTAQGNATASPGAVAGIGAVPAPTADGGVVNGTATPPAVAGIGSVPAPTAQGAATASPTATAGVGTVPAPTTTGTASTSPATVAGVGAVPSPTASGNATAAPPAVAGTGTVPAPSVFVSITALPAVTAGTGSVPAPTATGTANTSPATVAGIGSVPAPTASGVGNATANPAATAGIGSVPAPSASGTAKTTPAQVAGTGTVPAPTAAGPALAAPTVTAGIGAVPTPSARGNATATPGATAGIGAVPQATATSVVPGTSHPDEVAGIGSVPAPTVFVSARAQPQVCAGIGSVPAPTGHGNATAFPQGGSSEFTDEFTDEFGEGGSAPTAGVGAVPAPNAHGQGLPQQQHDFDPGRTQPRLTARAQSGWSGSPKEPALAGRANPEGGG